MQAGKVAKIDEVELKHLPLVKETAKRAEIVSDNGKRCGAAMQFTFFYSD